MSVRPATSLLLLTLMALGACSRASVAPSANPNAATLDAMRGQWASVDTTMAGACSRISVLVVPTGSETARVEFNATCGNASTSHVASGTVSGSTLVWASEYYGTLTIIAGTVRCTASTPPGGSLRLVDGSTATVTYSLRACGSDVGGTATLVLAR